MPGLEGNEKGWLRENFSAIPLSLSLFLSLSLSLSIHVASSLESIFLEKPLLRAYLFHRLSIYRQDVSTFIHLFHG